VRPTILAAQMKSMEVILRQADLARNRVSERRKSAPVVVQGKLRTVIRKDGLLICK
jgi:hypothetical protein